MKKAISLMLVVVFLAVLFPASNFSASALDYNGNIYYYEILDEAKAIIGADNGAISGITSYDAAKNDNWAFYAQPSDVNSYLGWGSTIRIESSDGFGWIAFKINIPQSGKYEMGIQYKYHYGAISGGIHLLPDNTAPEDIVSLLSNDNSVGVFNYTSGSSTTVSYGNKVGTVDIEAGDYILVLRSVEANTVSVGAGRSGLHINMLTLNGVEPQAALSDYAGDQYNTSFNFTTGFATPEQTTPPDSICDATAYNPSKNTNWHYYARSLETAPNNSSCTEYYGGVRISSIYTSWIAFKVSGVQAGKYHAKLSYKYHNGANKVGVYVLPADTAVEHINMAVIMQGNSTAVATYIQNPSQPLTQTPMGEITFPTSGEHILVFKVVEEGTASPYGQFHMTEFFLDGSKDAPTQFAGAGNSTAFDFMSGFNTTNPNNDEYLTNVTSYNYDYPSGADGTNYNWYYYAKSSALNYALESYGTISAVSGSTSAWIAFKVQIPASGVYTAKMSHKWHWGANKVALYFLPPNVAPATIENALSTKSPEGVLTYSYNDATGTFVYDSFGQVALAESGERIMVLKVVEGGASPRPAGRMEFTGLVLDGASPNSNAAYAGAAATKYIDFTNSGVASNATVKTINAYDPAKNKDWYYLTNAGLSDTYNYYGPIRSSGCDVGDWVAFKVKGPGAGKYALSITYKLFLTDANKVAVYVLPGNTPTNMIQYYAGGAGDAVGQFNYAGAAGTFTNPLGTVKLGTGEELIVVLKLVEKVSNNQYMDINGLTFDGAAPSRMVSITQPTNVTMTSDKQNATEGETVTVNVSNPYAGKCVTNLYVNGVSATKVNYSTFSFVMPDANTVITADTADEYSVSGEVVGTSGKKPVDIVLKDLSTGQEFTINSQWNETNPYQYSRFLPPEAKTYSITVSAPGYTTYTKSSVLINGNLSDVLPIIYAGQVNTDMVINVIDLAVLIQRYGQNAAQGDNADLNDDGKIDAGDIGVLIGNIGKRNIIE